MKGAGALVAGAGIVGLLLGAGFAPSAGASDDQTTPVATTRALTVTYQPDDEISESVDIDQLAPETVLTIYAFGFDLDTTGSVQQCLQAQERRCRNRLPVRFDESGTATIQYLVTDEVARSVDETERCRLGGSRCTIEITSDHRTTVVESVFVDKLPPPGRLDVSPTDNLQLGDKVTVKASGLPAGAAVRVMVCADPSINSRCGAPGPVDELTVGPDGTADTEMTLRAGAVGTDRVACGRQVTCRLVATSDQLGVRAPPVLLSFNKITGADYVAGRVIIGLAVALALLVYAGWLLRSTSWAAPAEADSSAIDDAEFADLDLEVDRFEDREQAGR